MNFDYSEDQRLLKDEARKLLAAQSPPVRCRQVLDDPYCGYDDRLWKTLAELGWLGLSLPEADGGLGLGAVELCALAEELGRAVAPIPFATTLYLFAEAVRIAGDSAQQARLLPAIAAGALIGTVATGETAGWNSSPPNAVYAQGALQGCKQLVVDGTTASHAIVMAAEDGAASLFLVDLHSPGVTRTPVHTLDESRKAGMIAFAGVMAERLGPVGAGLELMGQIEDRAAIFLAFEQIGGADRCLELARDYALERHTFGRPIGSYQAIKHKLADMFVRNQLARSNAYFGAAALIDASAPLRRAAAAARVAAAEAYWFASKELIEIFGGIGTTWEADCHLHYRRAKHLALLLGGTALWRERLAASIVDEFAEPVHGLA